MAGRMVLTKTAARDCHGEGLVLLTRASLPFFCVLGSLGGLGFVQGPLVHDYEDAEDQSVKQAVHTMNSHGKSRCGDWP